VADPGEGPVGPGYPSVWVKGKEEKPAGQLKQNKALPSP